MTNEEMDFIGSMNMCDEISNEAYQKIMTHCEEQESCDDYVDKKELLKSIEVALDATNINYEYSIGLRNGMRLVKSFVDGKRPDYEKVSHMKKQEPCEDAISREEVLAEILKKPAWHNSDGSYYHADDIRDAVKNMPSVTPQPKVGEWIFDEILDKHYYCSECKSMGVDYWDFCPNCGARMEVENDNR